MAIRFPYRPPYYTVEYTSGSDQQGLDRGQGPARFPEDPSARDLQRRDRLLTSMAIDPDPLTDDEFRGLEEEREDPRRGQTVTHHQVLAELGLE
jgi:hypothetical protein